MVEIDMKKYRYFSILQYLDTVELAQFAFETNRNLRAFGATYKEEIHCGGDEFRTHQHIFVKFPRRYTVIQVSIILGVPYEHIHGIKSIDALLRC